MDSEKQVILDLTPKQIREKEKNKVLTDNKKLYIFIYIMILIFFGIIYFIYIKKEIVDNAQSNQIKIDLLQNETRAKIINLENKMNLLENKLDNLSAKINEYNITNILIKNKDLKNLMKIFFNKSKVNK